MSTTEAQIPVMGENVMVKAYKGEPVQLRALRRHGNVVDVVGRNPNNFIGFPSNSVYILDESLFAELAAAYREGDEKQLAMLWASAEHY